MLISEGADLDFVCAKSRLTPLLVASLSGLDTVAVRLVAAGAKLDLVDVSGFSSLIRACLLKRTATAILLIEAGAAINLVAADGFAALDWAFTQGLASVTAALLVRGGLTGAELARRAAAV